MRTYLLCHTHAAAECPVAYAAWSGFDSPLRQQPALASCEMGGHGLWWTVRAEDEPGALAQLPGFVARRTAVVEVKEVLVP
jgi:hypothetical protein